MVEAGIFNLNTLPEIPKSFNVNEVVVAGDRGACGGVLRAIEATQIVLAQTQRVKQATGIIVPVTANHEIVHHGPINDELRENGLVIEPDSDKVAPKSIRLQSAHGTPPSVVKMLIERGVIVGNWECQLVYADRRRAEKILASGKDLVYFGVPNHLEPDAVTRDFDQERVHIIDSRKKAENIVLPSSPFGILSQTTISRRGVEGTVKAWGELNDVRIDPFKDGPCIATDNRQDALYDIYSDTSNPIDLAITVASEQSHNGDELHEIAKNALKKRRGLAIKVASIDQLDPSVFTSRVRRASITSAASVLDRYVVPFLQFFKKGRSSIRINPGKEDYTAFAVPKDLKVITDYLQQTYGVA